MQESLLLKLVYVLFLTLDSTVWLPLVSKGTYDVRNGESVVVFDSVSASWRRVYVSVFSTSLLDHESYDIVMPNDDGRWRMTTK